MNQRPVNQPHRRMTRAEVRRRRRSRAIRRVAGLTAAVCLFVGGAAFLLNRHAPVPSASAASARRRMRRTACFRQRPAPWRRPMAILWA